MPDYIDCDCKDWDYSMKQINSAQVLAYTHGARYDGQVFKFCPFCGKERQIKEDSK